jgi:hemin uptake protein HemP
MRLSITCFSIENCYHYTSFELKESRHVCTACCDLTAQQPQLFLHGCCNPSAAAGSSLGLDSALLLNGQKAVTILHNGTPYRLQATKLGKLILTK